jgi:hypothetical protein
MNVYEVTYKSKKSKKKEEKFLEKALPLDQCITNLSSVTESKNEKELLTPSEFFSVNSKMQENKKRKIPKFDNESIAVKESYFRKVWYTLYGTSYATWSSSLQEYYIDYALLWKNIVEPELFARGALLTWRTFPCKKIMIHLPKGFASWSDLLKQGGIQDSSTYKGSFTDEQKQHFWNDQCSCPCWNPVFTQKSNCLRSSSSIDCICKSSPCECNVIVVDNSWEAKLLKAKQVAKICPWNCYASSEVKDIEAKIQKGEPPLPNLTYREYVLGKRETLSVAKQIEDEENYQDSCSQKCFDFFYNLENDFIQDKQHLPSSGEEMLEWFWKGREEFLKIYRTKCPEERFKLLYLQGF